MELVGSAPLRVLPRASDFFAQGSDEFRALAEQLTVNETFFFRNADNFRAFAEIVLPERIRAKYPEKRLRILSAGCGLGRGTVFVGGPGARSVCPTSETGDVKIIGIDVNPAVLAKATQAR